MKPYEVNIIMQNLITNMISAIAVIVTAFTAVLRYDPSHLAFSKAVELLPISTGSEIRWQFTCIPNV